MSVELSTASYVVLGMLDGGSGTGYDIRRSSAYSTRFFWAISPAQIYSELKRLEDIEFIVGRDEATGSRPRRVYEITPLGQEALRDWICADEPMSLEIRDVGLLKLYFADAVEQDEARALAGQLRARSEDRVRRLRDQTVPLAHAAQAAEGVEFPAKVAELGKELHEWLAGWYGRLEDALAEQEKQSPKAS